MTLPLASEDSGPQDAAPRRTYAFAMNRCTLPLLLLSAITAPVLTGCTEDAPMTPELVERWDGESFFAMDAISLTGEPRPLSEFDGKVVLVVNVASACGFTPQYEGLQALHERLKDRGFAVLGFPSNDFGNQEPGSAEEIAEFCTGTFGVTFPMFEKVGVRAGDGQSPIYEFLGTRTGALPGWNFGKYLIGRDGTPMQYFASTVRPDSDELLAAIEEALSAAEG